ncbi:MAG: 6-bladed beta-propeller [Gemmatimonadota bacterium]
MRRKWLITLSAVWLALGCAADRQAEEGEPTVPFEELFSVEEVVHLRTAEADPIGRVEDVTVWDDRIAVVDGLGRNVKVFDPDGSLAITLGRVGDGPGEFRFPIAAAVDDRERLAVLDMAQGRVSFFTTEGDLDDSFAFVGAFTGRMEALDGGRRLLVTTLILSDDQTPLPHVGHVFDLVGNRLAWFGVRPEPVTPFEGPFLGTVMTTVDDTLAAWTTVGRHTLRLQRIDNAEDPSAASVGEGSEVSSIIPIPGFGSPDFTEVPADDQEELFLWATRQEMLFDLVGGPGMVIARFQSGDARRGEEVQRYALVPLDPDGLAIATGETEHLIQRWVGEMALGVSLDHEGDAHLYRYRVSTEHLRAGAGGP